MSDDSDTWPLPAYEVGQPKHIHALGVVAARYNMLEFALECLMFDYIGMSSDTTQYLFANLSNNLRLDLLKRCVEDREADNDTKEAMLHFVSCFSVCAENRNMTCAQIHSARRFSAHFIAGSCCFATRRYLLLASFPCVGARSAHTSNDQRLC